MTQRSGRGAQSSVEVVFAAVVIAVVAMMIVPLPRALLDLALALNLAASALLLVTAVLARRPLELTVFPTLLVVTTLFRVGLNVSTTRRILSEADGGAVVAAFGELVAAQSLVVGLVVFLVITIVQLVVVSRGAERVAEVAARFALDALPGKQMAIDSELRAGVLDKDAARARRVELERESQLYGAMDGAMRFIKGDAIAAVLIVVINLVGGMVVGVGVRGLSASAAASTYSILSIGEGLVSQIPSLVVAVAAGLLVTRVASAGNRALADELRPEAARNPKALVLVAALMAALALLPGMPAVVFLALALAAGAGALWMRGAAAARLAPDAPASAGVLDVRVGAVPPGGLAPALAAARRAVADRVGLPIPAITGRVDAALPERVLELDLRGTPLTSVELAAGDAASHAARLTAALCDALVEVAPELVDVDVVSRLLAEVAEVQPVLVKEVVPAMIGLSRLTEVVRALLREQVPLGDFSPVLAAIASISGGGGSSSAGGGAEPSVDALVEQVRARLQRQIRWRWAPRGELSVLTVDGMIEEALRTSIDRRGGEAILALEPDIAQDIIRAAKAAAAESPAAVVLTSGDVRRHLRELLAAELPGLAVLAPHELPAGTTVKAAARISV